MHCEKIEQLSGKETSLSLKESKRPGGIKIMAEQQFLCHPIRYYSQKAVRSMYIRYKH